MNNNDKTIKQGTDKHNWRVYQSKFLENNPLCQRCSDFSLDVEAVMIWHIEPVNSFDDLLFWESSNHMPICVDCYAVLNRNRAIVSNSNHASVRMLSVNHMSTIGHLKATSKSHNSRLNDNE